MRILPTAAAATWMDRKRRSPAAAWLRSGVAVGMNYGLEEDPLAAREAVVSVHARGRERHALHAGGKQALQSFMGPLRIMFPAASVVASAPENAQPVARERKIRSTSRLEYQFRHDHFPGIAFPAVAVFRR